MLKTVGARFDTIEEVRRNLGVALPTLARITALVLVAQSLGCIPFVPVI